MRCIQLSEEQAGSLVRMRELYLHNLGALMRRRQELSALLKVGASRVHGHVQTAGWRRSSRCQSSTGTLTRRLLFEQLYRSIS